MRYDTRWPVKGEVSLCECHDGIQKSEGIVHHSYLTLPLGEVNHQLHTLSVSLLLPTEEMAGWTTELVWKLRRKEKPLATAGKQMVTQLSSLQPSHYSKCANLTPSGYLFYNSVKCPCTSPLLDPNVFSCQLTIKYSFQHKYLFITTEPHIFVTYSEHQAIA